jgi:hypothetical protein
MSAIEMGPAKFMQKVLKIAEEVNRFFDVSLSDSVTYLNGFECSCLKKKPKSRTQPRRIQLLPPT